MPTSGSTDFALKRDEFLTGALRTLTVVGANQTPSASDMFLANRALNMLLKTWQSRSVWPWKIEQKDFTISTGQGSYTVGPGGDINGPRPVKVLEVLYDDGTKYVPTLQTTDREAIRGDGPTDPGPPERWWYYPSLGMGVLYVIPQPDDDYAGRIVQQRPFDDFDSAVDDPDFPPEWTEAIHFNLCASLLADFEVPADVQQLVAAKATATLQSLT